MSETAETNADADVVVAEQPVLPAPEVLTLDSFRSHVEQYKFPTKDVSIPELQKSTELVPPVIRLQAMSDVQFAEWSEMNKLREAAGVNGVKQYGTSAAALVAFCMIDPRTGKPMIASNQIAQETKRMPRELVNRLWEESARLSGLLKEQREDIRKNFESNPENVTGIISPEPAVAQ